MSVMIVFNDGSTTETDRETTVALQLQTIRLLCVGNICRFLPNRRFTPVVAATAFRANRLPTSRYFAVEFRAQTPTTAEIPPNIVAHLLPHNVPAAVLIASQCVSRASLMFSCRIFDMTKTPSLRGRPPLLLFRPKSIYMY